MKLFKRHKKQNFPTPDQMFTEYPDGVREHLLSDYGIQLPYTQFELAQQYWQEADRISRKQYARNTEASQLEREGKIDRAIELYELNIAGMFSGNHPYDRLRIIYSKRKQYDQALHVCHSFIKMANTLIEQGSPRGDLSTKRQKFAEWIPKLEARLEKQKAR